MIAAARAVAGGGSLQNAQRENTTVEFGAVMDRVRAAVQVIAPEDSAEALERDGVTYLAGDAVFAGEGSLRVGDRRISFRQAVIATGARPRGLDVDGADTVEALTSDDVWDLTVLPERLLIIGGGCMGCEVGQAMARLGSHVTIVQRGDHILQKEGSRAQEIIVGALTADGVDVRAGRTVRRIVSTAGRAGSAHLDDGSVIEFDRVLLALGRVPNTEGLGLKAAHVDTDDHGRVIIDDSTRTTNPPDLGRWRRHTDAAVHPRGRGARQHRRHQRGARHPATTGPQRHPTGDVHATRSRHRRRAGGRLRRDEQSSDHD